jgi:hypothetical protein
MSYKLSHELQELEFIPLLGKERPKIGTPGFAHLFRKSTVLRVNGGQPSQRKHIHGMPRGRHLDSTKHRIRAELMELSNALGALVGENTIEDAADTAATTEEGRKADYRSE